MYDLFEKHEDDWADTTVESEPGHAVQEVPGTSFHADELRLSTQFGNVSSNNVEPYDWL